MQEALYANLRAFEEYSGSITFEATPETDRWMESLKTVSTVNLSYVERPVKEQNLPYKCLGQVVAFLAGMGASNEDLRILLDKGLNASYKDIAGIYLKYAREGDDTDAASRYLQVL